MTINLKRVRILKNYKIITYIMSKALKLALPSKNQFNELKEHKNLKLQLHKTIIKK